MDRVVAKLHRHVRSAVRQSALAGKALVVAVSGGPDSLALLHALAHARGELDLTLHGAHLDHGLRGGASVRDARLVEERFGALEIELTSDRADVASVREARGASLEEAARDVRYAFLARVADERRADAIALGHTSDDQVETVLMHVIRGAGLAGLRGMETLSRRPVGQLDAVLFRPLLELTHQDTSEYCRALDLRPVMDESNLSRDMTRNRVRMDLLPLMEQLNPGVRHAIGRLSRTASRDLSYLEEQVERVWGETVQVHDAEVRLDRETFSALHPALQGHLLRRAAGHVNRGLRDLDQYQLDTMASLIGGPAGASLDLPGDLTFSVSYSSATLARGAGRTQRAARLDGRHALRIPGETLLPGWRVRASLEDPGVGGSHRFPAHPGAETGAAPEYPDGLAARLDYDAVDGGLSVRSRRPGDRFQPLGMDRAKKLQDFMVDARIPRVLRDGIPLVVSPRGIVWVMGWRIADWAKVTPEAKRALGLSFTRN